MTIHRVFDASRGDKPPHSNLGDKSTPSNVGDDSQHVKMLHVSRKSVGFHHGALGYILMHLIVQVVRQGAVIQIPEMGQHFQGDYKKSQHLKSFRWSDPLTTMRPLFPWAR
ncbi:hypothetical protein TNCV_4042841 [Trichonephila clavipes]|nr:hypothetical protein TNCV_4042841 [Trichonephila clavipes]